MIKYTQFKEYIDMTGSTGGEADPFAQQFDEAIAGIEAAARIEPYKDEILRAAYLGASALIDENEGLKPVEQITYRKGIAKLAGELATANADETTAAEMEAKVKDCDTILKLLKPQEQASGEQAEKPGEAQATTPAPKKRGRAKKADTSAKKTSGAKGS